MAGFSLLSVVCIFVVCFQDRDKLREQDHTLCAADSPNLISSGVSDNDKDEIVNLHNRLRGEVKPPAMDMPKLIWDDKLEVVAQKKANQCEMEHDTKKQRNIPAYGVAIGQNLAAGRRTWTEAIMEWYNEKENFKYGIGSYNGKTVGHYTQIVYHKAVRVGCGYAKCTYGHQRFYACNYAVGQDSKSPPYTEGKSCAKCLGSCKKGLCDCGGKLCKNGGKINLETCQCECTKLYTGNMCEKLTCPKKDARQHCGVHYLPAQCKKFSNVRESCPYMCGICKKTGCEWKLCKHHGYFSMETCSCECPKLYKGPTCEQKTCPKKDAWPCGSQFLPSHCERFSNVPESCPYMCGICKNTGCEWKLCKHGGTFDIKTCSCECPKLYKGPTCEQINCPQSDDSPCGSWPEDYCTNAYASFMKIHCPFKCGYCKKQ